MSKVTRYDLNEDVATGTPEISPVPDSFEGPFVSYEDYAALELLKEQYLNNWAKAEKKNSSLEVTCDELEARVKELEGRVTAHIVDRKRASEDKARLEAERDALQQQVNALADKLARSEDYCIGVDTERMEFINKCEALAAENLARGEIIERLIGHYSCAGYHAVQNSVNPAQSLLYDAMQAMKQTATDSIKRQWMAESLEMFASKITSKISEKGEPKSHYAYAYIAMNFADQLRQPEEKGHE